MRSCARMSARGWPKLGGGRGGRGVAHLIGVPPVRLFGGQILPPAMFRRCCRAFESRSRKCFWLRSESASAASTRSRCDSLRPLAARASYCWSWASIAARPPDLGGAHSRPKKQRVDSRILPLISFELPLCRDWPLPSDRIHRCHFCCDACPDPPRPDHRSAYLAVI
jgi:hypothetical protein